MRNFLPLTCLLVGLSGLSGCERKASEEPELPDVSEAFPSLPFPGLTEVVSKQGSADALQLTLRSKLTPEQAVAFYRASLSTGGWSLVSDMRDPSGAFLLYAEGTKPIWVRIIPDTSGSLISVNGAVSGLDTTYARKLRAAAETTNTMRPR